MAIIIAWLGFIGDWLLFAFPMFQGIMEVTEGSEMLKKVRVKKTYRRKTISKLLWLVPPLKLALERHNMRQIARYALQHNVDFDQIYHKMNVATAWIYVSFAGLLNGIVATEELLEKYEYGDNWWILIIICIIIISISSTLIRHLVSRDRKEAFYNRVNK